jgi:hypothetical protein
MKTEECESILRAPRHPWRRSLTFRYFALWAIFGLLGAAIMWVLHLSPTQFAILLTTHATAGTIGYWLGEGRI